MTRVVSEDQKLAASELHKAHWARCEAWGEALGVHHAAINNHWRCCFSNEPWQGLSGRLRKSQIERKAEIFDPCLKKEQVAWAKAQAEQREQENERRRHCALAEPDEVPDLDQRIKIMLWAIKKVGGVENAEDALRRAVRSLEDE